MAEDFLKDVQGDAGVGHPGRAGVTEPVASEVGQADAGDDLVPVRRVANGRGGEAISTGSAQERVIGLLARGGAFEDGFEGVEHRHWAVSSAFGLPFDDEAPSARVVLALIRTMRLSQSTSPARRPAISEPCAARRAANMT